MATFTALGGSHTCGYGGLKQVELFRTVAFKALRADGAVKRIQTSCIMGTGPLYPACCMPYFVPPATRYATIEYVSSMQNNRRLHLLHLRHMIQRLLDQRIRIAVVNIIPFDPNGTFTRTATDVSDIASELGVVVLTFDHQTNETLWQSPSRLNVLGHTLVGQSIAASLIQSHLMATRRGVPASGRGYFRAAVMCTTPRALEVLPRFARSLPACNGSASKV